MAGIVVQGQVVTGKGEATFFTQAEWARAAFQELVGIDPWPGTLNLQVLGADHLAAWAEVRQAPGLVLKAPNPEWCDGRLYPGRLAGHIDVAAVVPDVASYPDDQLEIIAAVHLRGALGVSDGAELMIELTL